MITLGLSGVNGVIVSRLVANFDSVNANQTIHLIATPLTLINLGVSSLLMQGFSVYIF